jgi:sn1-specific diacylglycerol lipase
VCSVGETVKEGVHESLSEIEKNTQMSDEGVAATAVAVNAAASTSNKDGLVNRRLYVPGSLYHIIREPLQQNPSNQEGTAPQQNSKQDDSHSQIQPKHGEKDSSNQSKSKDGKGSKKQEGSDSQEQFKQEGSAPTTPKFRYTVVKGTDPKSRFNRIVLSNSLINDHTTPSYVEALVDALQHASIGATPKQ